MRIPRDPRGLLILALVTVVGLGLLTWFPWKGDVTPPVSGPSSAETDPDSGDPVVAASDLTGVTPSGEPRTEAAPSAQLRAEEPVRGELSDREPIQVETHHLTGRLVADGRPLGNVRVQAWRDLLLPTVARMGETVTDPGGRFSIAGLEKGIYGLLLEGPGVPQGYRVERVILADRQDLDLGDVELPSPASLSGRIVDENGQAIPGVQVLDSPGALPKFDPAIRDIGLTLLETVTDGDGRFSFESVVSGKHSLLAVSADHMDRRFVGSADPGAHVDFGAITIKSGDTFIGHVVDPDGGPIVGAQVAPDYSIGGQVVEGVRTGTGGLFQLRGINKSWNLLVRAEGFTQRRFRSDEFPDPLLLTLERALVLTGRVEGHEGHTTQVELLGNLRDHVPLFALPPQSMLFPVEEDGSFRIGALAPPGAYVVRAVAEGLGASEKRSVLPGAEPVVLTIQPYPRVRVVVRDDRGRPVGNARVYTGPDLTRYMGIGRDLFLGRNGASRIRGLLQDDNREAAGTTSPEGRAEILQEPDTPVGLVVSHPGHLPGSFLSEPGSWPDPIEIVLQRAARLSGSLTVENDRHPASLTVDIQRTDKPEPGITASRWNVPVDREGRFHVEQMPAGTYDVSLHRRTMSARPMTGGQLARTIPLLGGGLDERSAQRVQLHAGESTEVVVDATPMGTVRGRVLHGNRPVAGTIVFASSPGSGETNWDLEDAHLSRAFTTTGEDGSFEFLYASAGTWEFRARHPQSPAPSSMSLVRATRPGQNIEQDLQLRAGQVRGTVDLESLAVEDRGQLAAYLFRLDRSAGDPFTRARGGLHLNRMASVPVDTDGRFELAYVPEGDWVLRLIARGRRVVLQRQVRGEPYLVTDLGVLRGGNVDVEIEVEIPEVTSDPIPRPMGLHSVELTPAIHIRQRLPGQERGIFVRAIPVATGKLRIEGLEPATYELELVDPRRGTIPGVSPVRILVVRADGTAEPAKLSFR